MNYAGNINVKAAFNKDYIVVPCSFDSSFPSFNIFGIKRSAFCNSKQADILALVYNYLLRSSKVKKVTVMNSLGKNNNLNDSECQHIYEMIMVILLLIKNNIFDENVSFNSDLPDELIKAAVSVINHYGLLFGRITQKGYKLIKYKHSSTLSISFTGKKADVMLIRSDKEVYSRELWFGRRITYRLGDDNKADCEYLLHEISPYQTFSEGQFEALCSILNSTGDSVCIMPTGSGKSLIFYMISYLQPMPVMIISPTDILISDQIRNLKEIHNIDDVSRLLHTEDDIFTEFDVCTKFTYMTPSTFQDRDLLSQFKFLNKGTQLNGLREEKVVPESKLAYIILDEIHCMSNWSHDFRPEYLMLAGHLKNYFTDVPIIGFTGTADYTVALDIRKQLDIPQNNIFSPIAYDKFNTEYSFICCKNVSEMQETVCDIIEKQIVSATRTIVFVKSPEQILFLSRKFGSRIVTFSGDTTDGYDLFSDNNSSVLVASADLGVGVNLPNVRCTLHFGLPMSKNDFVQQSGRAGRNNEDVISYVVYLEHENNAPEELIQRSLLFDIAPEAKQYNDYSDIISEIYHFSSQAVLKQTITDYYHYLDAKDRPLLIEKLSYDNIDNIKKILYMLYRIGYVNDWYSSADPYSIMIDIRSTNGNFLAESQNMLERVKERCLKFLEFIDEENDHAYDIQRSTSVEDVIDIFSEWYFSQYVYKHKEAFLDLFEFINNNLDSDNDTITNEIKNYYLLPFMKIKDDEEKYRSMIPMDIVRRFVRGVNRGTISNLERSLDESYNTNIDFAVFAGNLRLNRFDTNRMCRIINTDKDNYLSCIYQAITRLYNKTSIICRFEIIKWAYENSTILNDDFSAFLIKIYSSNPKDEIYYGIMAKSLNKKFKE